MMTRQPLQNNVLPLQLSVPRVRSTVSNLRKPGSSTSHRDPENSKTDRCIMLSIGQLSSPAQHISPVAALGLQ